MLGVAIITGFHAHLNLPIAASSRRAVGETLVAVDGVAVITTLPRLNHAVAAAGGLAIGAIVGGVFIAIIAALTRTQHAVTTTMKLTGVTAGIVIDCVAVVTSFVAINPLTQVASDHAIATSSQGAIA